MKSIDEIHQFLDDDKKEKMVKPKQVGYSAYLFVSGFIMGFIGITMMFIGFFNIDIGGYKEETGKVKDSVISIGDTPSGQHIDGDMVYWENQYARLEVYPHTSNEIVTQTQFFNFTWKLSDNNIDIAFRFPFELDTNSADIWLYQNISHDVIIHDYGMVNYNYTLINITDFQIISEPLSVDLGDIPSQHYAQGNASLWLDFEEKWLNRTFVIGFDNFTWLNPEHTECEFEFDSYGESGEHIEQQHWYSYVSKKHLFEHQFYNGQDYYFIKNIPVTQNKNYYGKWQYDIPINTQGKWELMAKLSSDSLSYALNNNRYIMIDPWWDSSWDYYKTISVSNKIDDYQMKINITKVSGGDVDCESHCEDDFSDIRFVSANTTELPYWIEYTDSGKYSIIWVNNSANVDSFEMYYGNNGVTTTSDGVKTWDNFEEWNTSHLGDYATVQRADGKDDYAHYNDNESTLGNSWRYLVKWFPSTWELSDASAGAGFGYSADEDDWYVNDGLQIWWLVDTDLGSDGNTGRLDFRAYINNVKTATGYVNTDFVQDGWNIIEVIASSDDYLQLQLFPQEHDTSTYTAELNGNNIITTGIDRNAWTSYSSSTTGLDHWAYNVSYVDYGGDYPSFGTVKFTSPWFCAGKYNATGVSQPVWNSFGAEQTEGVVQSWQSVNFDINGSCYNTSTWGDWTNIDFSINGSCYNTTGAWKSIDFSINGQATNSSTWGTWTHIDFSINGSAYNISTWGDWTSINHSINGSCHNTSVAVQTWQSIDFSINGQATNSSTWGTWTPILFSINGSCYNISGLLITITSEFPTNNTLNAPLQPTIYATIHSSMGLTMNVSWYYGTALTNCNTLLGTDTNFSNSTQTELYHTANTRSTNYYYRVQANDGNNYVNDTFTFKTEGYIGGGGTFPNNGAPLGIAAGALIFGILGFMIAIKRKRRRNKF